MALGGSRALGMPMQLYNKPGPDTFSINRRQWWRLPTSENTASGTTLVISVTAEEATYWVIANTILVTLIFMALSEIVLGCVLAFFPETDSGNLHAILISYYNAGRPSASLKLMMGYVKRSLFECQRDKKWVVDRLGLSASAMLSLAALTVIAGDTATKFLLGGKSLVVAHVAPANTGAIFYPDYNLLSNKSGRDILFSNMKAFLTPAIQQSLARQAMAKDKVRSMVKFNHEITPPRTGNSSQPWNAHFEYEYHLTGYEMGFIEGAGLRYFVKGNCTTFSGTNYSTPNWRNWGSSGREEQSDRYQVFNIASFDYVLLERENYTAPWAHASPVSPPNNYTNPPQNTSLYSPFTFMVTPHTAWRVSDSEKFNDPWYQTEKNPTFKEGDRLLANAPHRIKRGRPPLRCFQTDTWSYNGKSVHNVTELETLPGLQMPPFFRDYVFRFEFALPVIQTILNYLGTGSLASTTFYDANQRKVDAQRCNITADFERLLHVSYVYSRDIVRNTVLLNPTIDKHTLQNMATPANGNKGWSFWVETDDAVALSVFVLTVTPATCVILWAIVFIWRRIVHPDIDNGDGAKSLHDRRCLALPAVQIYRQFDEANSRKRRWSGRTSETPYIRDLSIDQPSMPTATFDDGRDVSISVAQDKGNGVQSEGDQITVATPTTTAEERNVRHSVFLDPRIVRFDLVQEPENGDPEVPEASGWQKILGAVKRAFLFWKKPETPTEKYDLTITTKWDQGLKKIKWKELQDKV